MARDSSDTLDSFDGGEGSGIEIRVIRSPDDDPNSIETIYAIRQSWFARSSRELVEDITERVGTDYHVLKLNATAFSWGASNAFIDILLSVGSGVTAAAIWDYLKTLPPDSSWGAPEELHRDEAIRVAKYEIAHAFRTTPETVADPVREVREDEHEWHFEIHDSGRVFDVEVTAALTGTRARIEVRRER